MGGVTDVRGNRNAAPPIRDDGPAAAVRPLDCRTALRESWTHLSLYLQQPLIGAQPRVFVFQLRHSRLAVWTFR